VKYAFFPGCSLEASAWDYDKSLRAVCRVLGIELEEIPDWVCCGATPAHATNASLAVALPAMNLVAARDMGYPVATPCAACYSRLRTANHKLRGDPQERQRVERMIGKPYDGGVEVRHILDLLVNDFGLDAIRAKVKRPLKGLNVACYYGCLLSRPPEIVAFDDAEHPTSMERLMVALGAEPVEWPYQTECCGAGLSVTQPDVVNRLGHRLLSMAREAGAQYIAVACQMCQMNLDLRQADAARAHGEIPETPVLFISQLMGLALGLSSDELGLDALTVSADALCGELGIDPTASTGRTP
jgi:heterodisulfide reductase subunit B